MKRRNLLVVTTGLAVGTGCLDDGQSPPEDDESDVSDDEPPDEPPFEIATIDAPGSTAGTIAVPNFDQHMLVNFTRTQCPTSAGLLETIGDARAALSERYDLGPDGTVQFLSVTNGTQGPTPTADELADWWVEHDGEWTLGVDETGACNDYYEITGFPTLVAIDPDGDVYWRSEGTTTPDNIESGVERELEPAADDESSDE